MKQMPQSISEYVREHFREGYINSSQHVKSNEGRILVKVEVIENDVNHHLLFDDEGNLIDRASDPLFEEDYYEGPFYGDEDEGMSGVEPSIENVP